MLNIESYISDIHTFGSNGYAAADTVTVGVGTEDREIRRLTLAVDSAPNSFCGIIFQFKKALDASEFNALSFRARGRNMNEVFEIKLKDSFGQDGYEDMVISRNFFDVQRDWTKHYLPFSLFSTVNKQRLTHLTIAANSNYSPNLQVLDLVDIQFESVALDEIELKRPDVFIVHGHDEEMKEAVARTLMHLKLNPIILREQPAGGATILENFLEYSDVGFAVVLLSPDDKGYAKGKPKTKKFRARQNVIFELGFFIGKLGRARVASLYRRGNDFEIPTDYAGVIYIPYDSPDGLWRNQLVRELRLAGFSVDANDLMP